MSILFLLGIVNKNFLINIVNLYKYNNFLIFIVKILFHMILRMKKFETLFFINRELFYLYIKSKICYNN